MERVIDNACVAEVLNAYGISSEPELVEIFGDGLINHTFRLKILGKSWLLQQVNTTIFSDIYRLDHNYIRLQKIYQAAFPQLKEKLPFYLSLEANRLTVHYHADNGTVWRLGRFIDDCYSCNAVDSSERAFSGARAYGDFQKMLLPEKVVYWYETIPDFHNPVNRMRLLLDAQKENRVGRNNQALDIFKKIMQYGDLVAECGKILRLRQVKRRVTHNDTKINNVLFQQRDNSAFCVVDWDTVMPGALMFDFGDMVRTMVPSVDEEQDYHEVFFRDDVFECVLNGYLDPLVNDLMDEEVLSLAYGSKLVPFIQTVRFLTDFLNGDTYYKTTSPDQNLNRAYNQFCLFEQILQHESFIVGGVRKFVG